jgi:hypothetical protein
LTRILAARASADGQEGPLKTGLKRSVGRKNALTHIELLHFQFLIRDSFLQFWIREGI